MFPRSEAEYADAHEIIDLCLGDRAPCGLIEFLSGTGHPVEEQTAVTRA
jgi:hypothetical protein